MSLTCKFVFLFSYHIRLLCHIKVCYLVLEYNYDSSKDCIEWTCKTTDVSQPIHDTVYFSLYLVKISAEFICNGCLHIVVEVVRPHCSLFNTENSFLIRIVYTNSHDTISQVKISHLHIIVVVLPYLRGNDIPHESALSLYSIFVLYLWFFEKFFVVESNKEFSWQPIINLLLCFALTRLSRMASLIAAFKTYSKLRALDCIVTASYMYIALHTHELVKNAKQVFLIFDSWLVEASIWFELRVSA